MRIFKPHLFKLVSISTLLIFWSSASFSEARIMIKNFCDQPVELHALNAFMDCEPSGIDMPKNKTIKLQVPSGSVKTCVPWDDNGQGSFYVEIQQQDPPRELSPQTADLIEDGQLFFYCDNSGSLGPCECSSLSRALNPL